MSKVRTDLKKELVKYLGITQAVAEDLISTDEGWKQYLDYEDKKWTVKGMNELMPILHEAAIKKGKTGWTANAKDAVVAMNILKEKLVDTKNAPVNIAGKNVQINMGWKFKPYKSK